MLTRRPITFLALLALALSVTFAADVQSATIVKFDLAGEPGPDIELTSGVLALRDDGNSGSGLESTGLAFFDFLSYVPDIPSGASMSISDISTFGDATVTLQGVVNQNTTGGTFNVWDNSDPDILLLSGTIGGGVITGSESGPSGGFFSTSPLVYTGGSLFPELNPNSGALSMSLLQIQTGDSTGLSVIDGALQDFTATANGQLEASAVPEPSVLGMAAIGALVVFRQHRRRKAKTA